ncbi:MAG TPA: ATP-binding protein [Chondromyces sp.]|nr:ATP-binding protein [Chondromyces sp.]
MSPSRGLLPEITVPAPVEGGAKVPERAYRTLRRTVVLATATVALVPLFITTIMNYVQYREALQAEAVQPMARLTLNTKRSLELFLSERRSVLTFLVHERSFADLCDEQALTRMISNLNRSLEVGAFVDLGVIDDAGNQPCYSGPYELAGRNYLDQDWFHEVARLGAYTSDVFLGFRNSPHFAIATKHDRDDGGFYILRATIDADMLSEQILTAGLNPNDDVFLISRDGVLQSPSRRYGDILQPFPMPVPHYSPSVEDVEIVDSHGERVFMSSAYIENSPFILIHVKPAREAMGRWFSLRSELVGFLVVSTALIIGVILWGSGQLIRRMREADERRAALYHHMEYSNKLASIGRLAAGVAHEINNPLAIINEKAGLVLDLVAVGPDSEQQQRLVAAVDSILRSVGRCKKVTHRLLGFARHMEVHNEPIDLENLLKEVLGFLEKEAEYRNLVVGFQVEEDLPMVNSDRGQLQQVFLNILNNAFAAVSEGGEIRIEIAREGADRVAVTVADNGVGIPQEHLERIFEPFFTTKQGSGTGLGLSITYGIVKKLDGEIRVDSSAGEGTRFTVSLPVSQKG